MVSISALQTIEPVSRYDCGV